MKRGNIVCIGRDKSVKALAVHGEDMRIRKLIVLGKCDGKDEVVFKGHEKIGPFRTAFIRLTAPIRKKTNLPLLEEFTKVEK